MTERLPGGDEIVLGIGTADLGPRRHGGEMGGWVTSMAFARGDATCNTFAFAADRSQLRLTTNGGAGCSNLNPLNQLPIRPATDIVLHTCFGKNPAQASNTETIYVTLGGVGSGHVYKTTNALGSKTWSDITPEDASGEPFDVPYNTIAIDPLVPSHLYVGTELGLWRSTDDGGSWTHVGPAEGLPYAPIFDIQMNDRTNQVVAFSHGRSAFKADLSRCVGDCNGDGTVTIGEAQLTNNIFLETNDVCVCRISDTNFDGQVTIGELQTAFNNLNGCP